MNNQNHLENENEKENQLRANTLSDLGIKDEYFLTDEQKEEIEFREKMIEGYQGKRRATETMRRECEVLRQSTTWEDGKLLEIDHIINTLTEQINNIKAGSK